MRHLLRASHLPLFSRLSPRIAAALAAVVSLGAALPAAAGPALERGWGTYFGGDSDDDASAAATDEAGNLYVAGVTTSDAGVATAGAHQTVRGGLFDAFLARFDPDGTLVWSTYFGGEKSETRVNLVVRGGRVVLTGSSASTTAIAGPGAFQPANSGAEDGFVAAFTTDGALEWSTYIGSAEWQESVNAAAIDADGHTYVAGELNGPVAGLGTPGTFQPEFADFPYQEGFLAKFTPQGELVWGTYHGGPGHQALTAVSLNALGELYVAGELRNAPRDLATPGAHQTFPGGEDDALLARYATDGALVWSTYYGGEDDEARPRAAALPQGGVLLAGETQSKAAIATPGTHQSTLPGGGSLFVARFDAAGARQWGTYYGSNRGDFVSLAALETDASGAAYLCGHTDAQGGITTPGGYRPALQGGNDAFLVKLTSGGARQWGTYYGGAELEVGRDVALDGAGHVYLVGQTKSDAGVATPGAHDETIAPPDFWDGFVVQFTEQSATFGDACADAEACAGGPCVDGVCCDSLCDDGCHTCLAREGAVADGVCTPLTADVVCRPAAGSCDVAETCPGDGFCPADAAAPDGTPCDDGMCSDGACVPAETSTTGTTGDDPTTGTTSDTTPPTSGAEPPTTGGSTSSSGDAPSTGPDEATGGSQGSDASGCGCRSDTGPALLGWPLLLLLYPRRRRAALA